MEDKNTDNMENKSEKGCCCHTSKHRSDKEYKDLMNRLWQMTSGTEKMRRLMNW